MDSLRKNMEPSGVNTEGEQMGQSCRQGSQEQATRVTVLNGLEGQLDPQITAVISPAHHTEGF